MNLAYRLKFKWLLAVLVAACIRHTRYRFPKDYRWGVTRWHRFVYACFCTFAANLMADDPHFFRSARHWFHYL